uniref:Uncharacterized protein n=1 Tax=Streptomyces sp. NBC_00003 TaxID=2903608 RepID=A0AAU2V9E9_9ACTN
MATGLALALTGFSGHGSHGKSHSSGGGCSNSHKSNGSSSGGSSSDSDTSTSSSTSSSSSTSGGGTGYNNGNRYGSTNTTGSTSSSSGSGSTSGTTTSVTSYVTECASAAKMLDSSTVRVTTGSGGGSRRYRVEVTFYDAAGAAVDRGTASVTMGPNADRTLTVTMSAPALVSKVSRCDSRVTNG